MQLEEKYDRHAGFPATNALIMTNGYHLDSMRLSSLFICPLPPTTVVFIFVWSSLRGHLYLHLIMAKCNPGQQMMTPVCLAKSQV